VTTIHQGARARVLAAPFVYGYARFGVEAARDCGASELDERATKTSGMRSRDGCIRALIRAAKMEIPHYPAYPIEARPSDQALRGFPRFFTIRIRLL
jgi:hypothetical protein